MAAATPAGGPQARDVVALVQLARTINRHGNKAAHQVTLDDVTITDCNSVLTSLQQLLRDFNV